MLRNFAISIAALTAITVSIQAQAKTWFEVEVFVFERQSNSLEQWQENTAMPANRKNIDLITPMISNDITGVALGLTGCTSTDWTSSEVDCQDPLVSANKTTFPSQVPLSIAADEPQVAYLEEGPLLLAESQSEFADIIKTVRREKDVRSLLHLTWQQDMQSRNRAKPIRIFAGKDFSEEYDYAGNPVAEEIEDEFTTFDFSSSFGSFVDEPQTKPVWELDGNINIYLSHYLFIETNLALRKPIKKQTNTNDYYQYSTEGNDETVMSPFLQSIPMVQNRRVRSGEVHYFDHPNMGIIMQIRKMEQPTTTKPADLVIEDDSLIELNAEPVTESMASGINSTQRQLN
ncbi:peptidoglycan binding protein CsiV [Shewanella goraebulensis]|uniref:peptidoglycan binding protein CsiV n=1 Tax=Shewanella goraebulensis TaxID=3050637 RepID=UPI00254EF87B|nr:peptidoglycan binding protein CsiV [Shewanella goraebulensis]